MPQIFRPTTDLILRLLLLGGLLLLIAAIVIWHVSLASQPRLGQPVEQPIPFSHKHHVAEVGLDCRY